MAAKYYNQVDATISPAFAALVECETQFSKVAIQTIETILAPRAVAPNCEAVQGKIDFRPHNSAARLSLLKLVNDASES